MPIWAAILWVSAVDYTDGEGSGKGVPGSGTRAVQAAPPTNEPPAFPPTENGARAIEENTGPGRDIGPQVTATDPGQRRHAHLHPERDRRRVLRHRRVVRPVADEGDP